MIVSCFDCILKVGVLGLNFKTADLSFLESIAKGASFFSDEKGIFFPHPIVLLSTCNRTEIYFSAENLAAAHSDLLAILRQNISNSFDQRLYSYFGLDCFIHLAKVTAGLDSAIVGETEIQSQVKNAYLRAQNYFKLSSCLHFVFQKSLRIGKSFRDKNQIKAPSLYAIIWELCNFHQIHWDRAKILLVGFSDTNRKMGRFLFSRGVAPFFLSTNSPKSVDIFGCIAKDRSILKQWDDFDLLIFASSSHQYLIQEGGKKKHLIFDLSVPRNVSPYLGQKEGILLYNIEQIHQIIQQKRTKMTPLVEAGEKAIAMEAMRHTYLYSNRIKRHSLQFQKFTV